MSKDAETDGRNSLDRRRTYESSIGSTAPQSSDPTESTAKTVTPRQGHQKLVFSDPVAFRYLEEDPATIVLERRRRLEGFEIYVVEQWACSRVHPTFIIATYTGDASHSILVGVLSVPMDESTWSSRLKVYFSAVSQFHTRKMETPLGILMVTNLSGFPSALTVIPVPDGDVRKHREEFIVNENLKRLGCSGRAGMNLQPPQASTIAKFHQVYRTSESVPLEASVMELVKLCQTALIMYGKLLSAYADGLLCDITEKAITDWWTDIGTYFYNIEPSDGILGPTTVAALLGLMLGAYNRLKADGQAVGKDVLDMSSMKRAIGAFQRSQKLEKTRRLDRQTLDRLHQATAKMARGEGWNVPKAVKSTVAELSGKGGEMVMGIVGARDKASIAEVETLDIDQLAQHVSGPKMKWLWQGKHIKSTAADLFGRPTDELNGRVFSTDDQGNFLWTSQQRDSVYDSNMAKRVELAYSHAGESKSGLGRLRDAVGLGGLNTHQHKSTKDNEQEKPRRASADDIPTSRPAKDTDGKPIHNTRPVAEQRSATNLAEKSASVLGLAVPHPGDSLSVVHSTGSLKAMSTNSALSRPTRPTIGKKQSSRSRRSKIASLREELEADPVFQDFSSEFHYDGPQSRLLRQSRSAIRLQETELDDPRSNRFSRHLSFGNVESSILRSSDAVTGHDSVESEEDGKLEPNARMIIQKTEVRVAEKQAKAVLYLDQAAIPYVTNLVNNVQQLDSQSREHTEELNNLYYQRLEEYQALRATSTDLVSTEKSALMEGVRRVEMVGSKLDYELNVLDSRVKETEEGLAEFERDVLDIEARVLQLTHDGSERVSWLSPLLRFM